MKIKDPMKEFLFVMDIYLDKTGKSAGITSSCGEPVIWTTPLLTSEAGSQVPCSYLRIRRRV
jgi:hypothetical protein